MSTTSEPESEEVTKKTTTRMMAMADRRLPRGSVARVSKRATSATSPSSGTRSPTVRCRWMAVPPSAVNHRNPRSVGTSSAPATNSRIVRPREIRAMNTPTKGDQAIHQPQ